MRTPTSTTHNSANTRTYEQMLFKASAYCATAEHCEADVRTKLQTWACAPEHIDKIIDYLKQENFLNEQRYCNAFVRDKFRFNQWGKTKIAMMLRTKNIAEETIAEAIDQIDDETYQQTVTTLLQTKLKGLKYRDEYDRKAKLIRFAQGRGFEYGIIAAAIEQLP
ncbi:MAG: regulatory protein RecX [Paludibacteraceae bacterium]|nr:regulatory protein RecX [Paludibacteraceae bacterium]